MSDSLLSTAMAYRRAGLSVIPIMSDGTKSPAVTSWNEYRDRHATDDELELWFGSGELVGIAVVCGRVSGGLEVFDFDSPEAWCRWQTLPAVKGKAAYWLARPRVRTPAGGVHLYLRRRETAGNRKLAKDPVGKTLLEVKGEGGYVLAPGCPPECHPSGRIYTWEVPLPGLEVLMP
jgi:hypothetical protein